MDNATLGVCILLNQRERNKAIGINQDTQLLRGLSAYVRNTNNEQIKSDVSLVVRAVYLKAMIEEYQVLAGRLTEYITANIDDADTRNEGIYVMKNLDAYISHLGDELEALWLP